MKQLVNCPNCGAPIHDYICDYCGTIFPTDIDSFNGRNALLISIDDDRNLFLQNLSINSIKSERSYDSFYNNTRYYMLERSNEISIIGSIYDNKALMHHLKELKNIFNTRLKF